MPVHARERGRCWAEHGVRQRRRGQVHLARNDAYENQAFRVGTRAYGLQFHVEVTGALVAHWGPHLPAGFFIRASDVALVARAGDGVVQRVVELCARGAR